MTNIREILINSKLKGVDQVKNQPGQGPAAAQPSSNKKFEEALTTAELRFSKHAERRLDSRAIELSEGERTQLGEAVSSLEKKGAKDSLVLMGEHAFVVNVPSKTVVTAMQRDQMKEQIFTNIDSTMLVDQES